MADNRKYYYLKLKENFFDSDSIVLLEDMQIPAERRSHSEMSGVPIPT